MNVSESERACDIRPAALDAAAVVVVVVAAADVLGRCCWLFVAFSRCFALPSHSFGFIL